MKKLILPVLLVITAFSGIAGTIVVEGKYQNKNLYVQNTPAESGVGFCVYEVTINGRVSTDEVNSSAFEIDFSQFQLKPGMEVIVEIKHRDGCTPKILNPEALKPRATFDVVSLSISPEGLLQWSTKNESGSLPFIVEQFKWNKWTPIGEVQGVGTEAENRYSFQITPHSGENRFRVKQVGYGSKAKVSDAINYSSQLPQLSYSLSRGANEIIISGESMYEVYDYYGSIVKKGYGKTINISNLPKGNYFFCFDNVIEEFRKR